MGKRNQNIVVKSQFSINGSRGKNVASFISDYVTREDAVLPSMAYVPPTTRPLEKGDGVAFTLDSTAISRARTLNIAEKVQAYHVEKNRAIQQLVISFSHDYLVKQGIVEEDLEVLQKGAYEGCYDDVRLRHAVQKGFHAMIENEGYHHANFVAAIQSDTTHLHVHAVLYEDFPEIARKRGREEKGVLKDSSFGQLVQNIDRNLTLTRDLACIPTPNMLFVDSDKEKDDDEAVKVSDVQIQDMDLNLDRIHAFLRLLEQEEEEKEKELLERMEQDAEDLRKEKEREEEQKKKVTNTYLEL